MDKKQLIKGIISDCRKHTSDLSTGYYVHISIVEQILETHFKDIWIDKVYDYTKCAVCNAITPDGSVLCDSCKADSQKDNHEEFDSSLGEFIKVKNNE